MRERGNDVEVLARHLVARHAAQLGRPIPHLSPEVLAFIGAHDWPGNVRELENALARAVAMSQRGVILPGDLPLLPAAAPPVAGTALHEDWPTLDELGRRYIERVLEHTGHNKTSAAAILGIDRRTIQRLAARQGPPRDEPGASPQVPGEPETDDDGADGDPR